ncbi:sulfatase [Actinoplanes sp. NPDC051859]|uniref:sulfatase n=1 Tax=Actinoplanes sp. NPDC051859 TaxID=3363909 RepID=UPI003791FA06
MGFRLRAAAGVLAAVSLLMACTADRPPTPTASSAAAAAARPNIVLVLTDDLSMNLVRHMPQVLELQRRGTTFTNYTVSNSLCCPSRASMLTGKFPHGTGIYTNDGIDGGFVQFRRRGHERSTFATDLHTAGYRTAFFGKYLNRYQPSSKHVPPGWTEWHAGGNGYAQFDYALNENGTVRRYGSAPGDYLTDVLSEKASAFIEKSAADRTPFLLEVATFAPHSPYTPAPRDANLFPGLKAPRGPAFDAMGENAPPWLASRTPLTVDQQAEIDTVFRKRAQSVQSIDRMLAALLDTVRRAGVAGTTLIMFTSDNGFHTGEYRLMPGKQTAFDSDILVPLVISGPGVEAGRQVDAPVQNVDLRPTFASLAGTTVPADVHGRDFRPLLAGKTSPDWRTAALVEHHGPDFDPTDPDRPRPFSGNPPTYAALRTATYTYVEYVDGAREYYNRRKDPHQLRNIYADLSASRRAALHRALKKLTMCRGAACRTADQVRG